MKDGNAVTATQMVEGSATITEFVTLEALAVRCGPTQHDYTQGHDPMVVGDDVAPSDLSRLLFCTQCGDVIRFGLPVEVPSE